MSLEKTPDPSGLAELIRRRDQLEASLQRVLAAIAAADTGPSAAAVPSSGIVAESPAMRRLVDLARRVARVDATVLITGESGAGKERISRLVHDGSARAAGPFVAVNCGAIAETLLESELFGHARGAFTGASNDRMGLFETANRGTILLDEVGEVSPAMQVKLLRVLQEREVRRVGESHLRKIDVRVLAATNRDLAHGVAGGAFRQDLYYRLKVIELNVPALRDRTEDILPLAHALLQGSALRMRRGALTIPPDVQAMLCAYDWPGNVRELENAMERAMALGEGGRVAPDDLPDEVKGFGGPQRAEAPASDGSAPLAAATSAGGVRSLDAVEKEAILAALEVNDGNQTQTAAQLGIGSATLYRKLKSYRAIGIAKASDGR
jgi:two-component system, NtrC family, response regulator HydG